MTLGFENLQSNSASPVSCPSIFHCPSSSFLNLDTRQKSSETMAKCLFAGRHLPELCTWLHHGCSQCAANSVSPKKYQKLGLEGDGEGSSHPHVLPRCLGLPGRAMPWSGPAGFAGLSPSLETFKTRLDKVLCSLL